MSISGSVLDFHILRFEINDFMNNKDKLQRFLFEKSSVRGEIVHLNQSFKEILSRHGYPKIIQKLLGEALVLTSLLTAIIKFKGRLTLQFQSQSGLKLLLVQCNEQLHLRGLAQWEGELNEEELLTNLKKGVLVIIMDPDSSTQRYQGIVAWQGNSLAESIEGYFRDSEQLQTRIWLAIDEDKAAGLLLQMMPSEEAHSQPSAQTAWEDLTILTDTVKAEELLNLDTTLLLHRLYNQNEEELRLFESVDVMFQCTCSAKRGENAILLLGEAEVQEELNEKQVIVVKCDFCNKEFIFDRVDVANIFRNQGTPPASTLIH
jgi:molecular chaperone Hsp33